MCENQSISKNHLQNIQKGELIVVLFVRWIKILIQIYLYIYIYIYNYLVILIFFYKDIT